MVIAAGAMVSAEPFGIGSPESLRDLESIRTYIAEDSPLTSHLLETGYDIRAFSR